MTEQASAAFFLSRWVRNPLRVGAIAPSGKELAQLISSASARHHDGCGRVVELGGGTGAVTKALVDRFGSEKMVVVDIDPAMVHRLKVRFPEAEILHGDATSLRSIIPPASAAVVASCIPLVSFSSKMKAQVVDSAFQILNEGGTFIQFTYGLTSPVPRSLCKSFGLIAKREGFVARNLPPAFVWSYKKA